MLYSATPTGMRTLAGDYRDADIRRAAIRRATKAANAAPAGTAGQLASASRIARLITLLPHAH